MYICFCKQCYCTCFFNKEKELKLQNEINKTLIIKCYICNKYVVSSIPLTEFMN